MAYQVSVFLENKPGHFEKVTKILADAGINIRAMTFSTSASGWGISNLLVNRPEEAAQTLKESGISAALREIVAVKMEDAPGSLHDMLVLLAKAAINVENAYGTVLRDDNSAILVIDVENVELTSSLLSEHGITQLDDKDVYGM